MRLRVNRITDSVHSFISSACTVQPVDQSSASVNIHTGESMPAQSCQWISQHSHWRINASTVLSVDQSTFTPDVHCLHSPVNIHIRCSLTAQSCQHSHWIFTACSPVNIHTGYSLTAQSCQPSHWIFTDCRPVNIHTGYSLTAYPVNWLRPVMAIMASMQSECWMVYAGSDFPHLFQFCFSKEGMDHIVQN